MRSMETTNAVHIHGSGRQNNEVTYYCLKGYRFHCARIEDGRIVITVGDPAQHPGFDLTDVYHDGTSGPHREA